MSAIIGVTGLASTGVDVGVIGLAEIRHYRYLIGVVQEYVLNPVGDRRIIEVLWVRPWMTEAESMANLMDVDNERPTAQRGSILNVDSLPER